MKAFKLLLIAILLIAAIIGVSKLLGGSDPDISQRENRENKLMNEIIKLIKDGEKSNWDVDLKVNYYNDIVNKINTYQKSNSDMITPSMANDLKRSLDLTYMDILSRFINTTIPKCELNRNFIDEVNSFYNINKEHKDIKESYQSIQDYNAAYSVMKNASDLKEKISDTFDGDNIHKRADQLKKIELINQCKRIKDGLQNVDTDLANAHLRFLERQSEIYKNDDYSEIKDLKSLRDKLKPLFDNIDAFEKITYYPQNIKSQVKTLKSDMESFLNIMENKVSERTTN